MCSFLNISHGNIIVHNFCFCNMYDTKLQELDPDPVLQEFIPVCLLELLCYLPREQYSIGSLANQINWRMQMFEFKSLFLTHDLLISKRQ